MRPGQRPQPADDRGLNVVDAIERAPGGLTLPDLSRLLSERPSLALTGDWRTVVQAGADVVAAIAAGDEPVYGVNTGFGLLARESASPRASSATCSAAWCARTPPASVRPWTTAACI